MTADEEDQLLIDSVAVAALEKRIRPEFENYLRGMQSQGWAQLVAAIRRVIEGERDPSVFAFLDAEDNRIIKSTLDVLANKELLVTKILISAQKMLGKSPEQAENLVAIAINAMPENPNVHGVMGEVLQAKGNPKAALASYQHALSLKHDQPVVMLNVGVIQTELKQFDDAVGTFENILEIEPENIHAIFHLAYLYERSYRLNEAKELVERGLRLTPDSAELWFMTGKLRQRDNDLKRAIDAYERAIQYQLQPALVGELYSRLGYLYDRVGEIARATDSFKRSNEEYTKQCRQRGVDGRVFLDEIDFLGRLTLAKADKGGEDDSRDLPSPVFLIGFPRSGTTLLNQILDSHNGIQTLEEKPGVSNMVTELYKRMQHRPDALTQLRPRDIKLLRNAYYSTVGQFIALDPGKVFIDKFPLNIIYVRILYRVFPNAKYILALRHPCDAALSCYMHSFGCNAAMANFADMGTTINLFSKAQGLWQRFAAEVDVPTLQVRYEDLINNFVGEAGRLLDFLGLPWDQDIEKYAEKARVRGFIDTPSYDQVTEPLYSRAIGRWKQYQPLFQSREATIKEMCETYGYQWP